MKTPQWAPNFLSLLRIAIGLLFFQHGAEKIWGFAGGRPDHNFASMHGFAGPLEVIGGTLLIILCGEMAVAYFSRWAPRGFWPISNGGEEAVICCYIFLWLVTSGAGPWSLDRMIEARSKRASVDMREPRTATVSR
jgi:putative oxidoreductase